ncbi:MAG TPA: hypothetical protein VFD36_14860 [Kofleriaceae bacterium]|nr:hypothetical protein [Kofleriaceae bacterium]
MLIRGERRNASPASGLGNRRLATQVLLRQSTARATTPASSAAERLTNTARNFYITDAAFAAPQPFNFGGSIGPTVVMDSMGWRPSPALDRWATDAYFPQPAQSWPGGGTLSPDLWISEPPINW